MVGTDVAGISGYSFSIPVVMLLASIRNTGNYTLAITVVIRRLINSTELLNVLVFLPVVGRSHNYKKPAGENRGSDG